MTADGALHGPAADLGSLPEDVVRFVRARLASVPLGRTGTVDELRPVVEGSITARGLGPEEAWRRFTTGVAPASIGLAGERFLAFVPMAPSAASVWMDAALAAATFSAESWLEAAGPVAAEHEAIRVLADLAGLGPGAGGCFVSGGSIGNLSALAVARERHPQRPVIAVADTAHSSVDLSARLLRLEVLSIPTDRDGRLRGDDAARALRGRTDVGIVVASAGSTNAGLIDDLAGVAAVAEDLGAWFHVDGAYGAAALLVPELRARFAGLERADSLIVDPHKWLFATAGSCAVIYREPGTAAQVHTQHGPYLDLLHGGDGMANPCDLGFQLTRRASGLPLWFSLAVHGLDAHGAAVARGIELAAMAAERLRGTAGIELVVEPELSVVLFRKAGWDRQDWVVWSRRLLEDGVAFVAPTTWRGEAVGRLVFLHPGTGPDVIDEIVASLG